MRRSARVAGVLIAIGLVWWGIRASGPDPVRRAQASDTPPQPITGRPAQPARPKPAAAAGELLGSRPASAPSGEVSPLLMAASGEGDPNGFQSGGTIASDVNESEIRLGSVSFTLIDSPCPGDFNHDGTVDGSDFSQFTESYHAFNDADSTSADLNGDGFVDFSDLEDMQVAMEQGCPPAANIARTILFERTNLELGQELQSSGEFRVQLQLHLGDLKVRTEPPGERPAEDTGNRPSELIVRTARDGR